jgi:hypothetical protein
VLAPSAGGAMPGADGVHAGRDAQSAAALARVTADAVVQSVTQRVAEQAGALRRDGSHSWVVHVEPDEFGAVRVELVLQDQRVTADIVTSHPVVKELFQHHQGELRHALAEQGFRVDRLSVNVGDPGQQSPNRWLDAGRWFGPEHESSVPVESRSGGSIPNGTATSPWSESGSSQAVNVYV